MKCFELVFNTFDLLKKNNNNTSVKSLRLNRPIFPNPLYCYIITPKQLNTVNDNITKFIYLLSIIICIWELFT